MNLPASNDHASPADEMNRQGRRIQELVERIEALPDPHARGLVHECLSTLLAFYGQGLERTLQLLQRSGIGGQQAYEELIHDRIFSSLLLIHGLHPADLETRLAEALEKIRPYMQSHGGDVELLSLEDDFARLRLDGACKTCPSSAVTMELAVRHAIEEACPDLAGFEVEGLPHAVESEQPHAAPEWTAVPEALGLREGSLIRALVLGVPLIICRTGESHYAYRDRCPACNLPLHLGTLQGGVIACRAGHRFSVREAGRSPDDSRLHLEPVPLVVNHDSVQVALAPETEQPELAEAGG